MDNSIKELIAYLGSQGMLNNTIVVITADHGEEFNEHGGCEHGRTLYDEVLHVPLIIHAPSIQPRRVETQVSLIDLAPTILDLLGMEHRSMEGRSLKPLLWGEAMPEAPVFSESILHGSQKKSVRYSGFKLVYGLQNDSYELYDLKKDPKELANVYPLAPAEDLRRLLHGWMTNSTPKSIDVKINLSEESLQQLKDIGYIM